MYRMSPQNILFANLTPQHTIKMKLSFVAPLFIAMGASAFQAMPNTRSHTALHASAPMGGPGVPPPAVSLFCC